jgi:putative glycosyltransferase (TIGR04348 family)
VLKVALITPAGRGSRAGNRATATRWAGLLRELGCRVRIAGSEDGPEACRLAGQPPELVLALHAWRSHAAILACRDAFPDCPRVVVLTGTDVYRFQHSHPEAFLESLAAADALIGLHDCLAEDLPARFLPRLHVVHQSARPLPPRAPPPGRRHLDVLVAGHLREEKDPLRAALAVRELPASSRLRVIQLGGVLDEAWARAARDEMADNPRYRWLGDQPRWRVRRWMARARLMVISSRMEGGANVVSEACVAGLPVLASAIPGNRGLLGEDYAGYFPVADTAALKTLLGRAEAEPAFVDRLRHQVLARAPLFRPEAEREGLARVIAACGLIP